MAKHEEHIQKQVDNLGKRLRELRKEKGFKNQEQFAYEHELSRAQYARYEKGSDMYFTSLLKVLNVLDISLEEFFSEGFEK